MLKRLALVAAILGLGLGGCGGGGGSSGTNADGETLSGIKVGYILPTEVSAIPADSGGDNITGIQMAAGFMTHIRALVTGVAVDALPEASDYKKTNTRKYVEERALEQFAIIEQIMNAVAQTHYADEENVNAGPYKAMIAWVDEGEGGREVKTLQPWVVDSRMIVVNGQDINRLLVWIEEPDDQNPGSTRLIKAEFKIYTPAVVNADGSYANYGEWDLNVSFDGNGDTFFVASSRISGGVNTIMLHEKGAGGFSENETRGVLVRSGTTGHGKVAYPNWDACQGPDDCTPPVKTAQYAYNTDYVVIDADINDAGADAPVYKDRNPANAVDLTRRYGLFYASAGTNPTHAAGEDVQKTRSFGFPVSYSDSNNVHRYAYYGAWQGRHQLWGNGGNGAIQPGTQVVRQDHGSGPAVTYTVSVPFNGTLTKRTLVDGALTDIQGIVVETWLSKHWDLRWNQADNEWQSCAGWIEWGWDPNSQQSTLTCRAFTASGDSNPPADIGFTTFDGFDMLAMDASGRKWVNVGRWDSNSQQPVNYVYDANGPGGAGFYVAQQVQGDHGMVWQSTGTKYNPQDGDNMSVDIGGSIYIQYVDDYDGPATTTGWVQKRLQSFDQQTWTPTFDPSGDSEFLPEPGRDYYINSRGANYIVKRMDGATPINAGKYKVMVELQTAANPVNAASLLPTGTAYLSTPWRPDVRFTFMTNSNNANFMKLVYLTDDPNTPVDESTTPTVYTSGEWGLKAYNSSGLPLMANGTPVTVDQYGNPVNPSQRPVEFNWEYSSGGNGWGAQTYLLDGNGQYVLLSDPILLQPVTLTNGAGQEKTLALQFDGWMHGLPDMYYELARNDWQMSQEIKDKIINIPAGTEVTDASDGATKYYVKPLETSVFLAEVPDTTPGLPDITDADAVDLANVPNYVAHGMGAMPSNVTVKYSEGIPVGNGG